MLMQLDCGHTAGRHKSNRACKVCSRIYQRHRDQERADYLAVYKLFRGCSRCGYEQSSAALDLHHRDKTDKKIKSGLGWWRASKDRLLAELDKCDVICSNCHRELHAR